MAVGDITAKLQSSLEAGGTQLKDILTKSAQDTKAEFQKFDSNVSKFADKIGDGTEAAASLNAKADALESGIDANRVKFEKASSLFANSFKNFGSKFKQEQSKQLDKFSEATEGTAEGFGSIFGGASDAIKDLTGGLVDIQDMVDDGMKMVKGAVTLASAPFKIANTAIAKTTKFFTGKEFNIGEKITTFLKGTGEVVDKETGEVDKGLFGKFGDAFTNFKANIVAGIKTVGGTVARVVKTGFIAMKNGLAVVGKQLMAFGARMLAAIVPLVASAAAFVAGLISTGVSLLIAAAPFIGIALLVGLAVAALVMAGKYIYDKFQENKELIFSKFQEMKDKVANVVSNIVGFFTNIWQGISDFIREKVLKIKSFLGLTSEEEEKELADINARKAKKKDQRKRAEEAAQAEMDYMEETGQLEGMSRREKRKLRKQKEKDALARIEEQDEYDAQSSQEILDRRDAGRQQADYARRQMEEKERYVNVATMTGEMTRDGVEVTDMDERREMAQRSADARFGTDEELREMNREGINEAIRAEYTLSGRDDYISARELTDEEDAALMAKHNLTEEDLEPENINQFDSDQNAYFAERDRLDGDRIKDARDAAEEMSQMPPKPTQLQSNAAVQQNNNVNNTFRVERPTPRNNEPTGTRLSQVPA